MFIKTVDHIKNDFHTITPIIMCVFITFNL